MTETKQMYKIGDRVFKSKKECEGYTRNIINSLGAITIKRDHDCYSFFVDLLENHPECEEKIGIGIDYFYIQHNTFNRKAYHTMIKRLDGSTIDFSWLLCCKFQNRMADEDLSMAMRFAVRDDILKFRETAPIICNICKETSDECSGNFHVDHYNPPFRELKQRFLESSEQIPK